MGLKWILPLILLLPGCVTAGTHAKYNPQTHEFSFDRPWLGGPVAFSGKADLPDGTHVEWNWSSEVNLDAAQAVRLKEIELTKAAVDAAITAAKAAGGAP